VRRASERERESGVAFYDDDESEPRARKKESKEGLGTMAVTGKVQSGRRCCTSSASQSSWSRTTVPSAGSRGRRSYTVWRKNEGSEYVGSLGRSLASVEVKHSGTGLRSLAAKAEKGSGSVTVLTKAEIPAFIPRDDFIQQLYQWAEISVGQRGRAAFGYAMVVEKLYVGEELKGFTCQVGNETTIEVGMDNEVTEKYEFISRGPDGFPVPKGKCEEIKGKYLEVRKADSNEVSENAKHAIRELISQVMKAFDSYYAFGSVFSHDST